MEFTCTEHVCFPCLHHRLRLVKFKRKSIRNTDTILMKTALHATKMAASILKYWNINSMQFYGIECTYHKDS